ncbi:UbiA prenyltransferase [Apiospora marii]|uniref:UbiA prenyltransferase n=1 Tax=Apiospora marii TaxID=335849 RepID=A0ABR1RV18_9PEZI
MWSSNLRLDRHIYTLYLVTASDIVSVLVPQTLFASFAALSGQFVDDRAHLPLGVLSARLPHVVLWLWLHLLVLDLANQRLPDSVAEDSLNKPWRPIPAGRLTPSGARHLLIFSIALTYVLSALLLGAVYETLLLFALNWLYNDLGLANDHWFLRSLMNAAGLTTMGAGALTVALHQDCGLTLDDGAAYRWFLLCAGVLLTTIQAQDLYDQEGDAARQRSTAPLVWGDAATRWSVAAAVLFWSISMPALLGLQLPEDGVAYVASASAGISVAARVLLRRGVAEDKATFKVWAVWLVFLYALPLAV